MLRYLSLLRIGHKKHTKTNKGHKNLLGFLRDTKRSLKFYVVKSKKGYVQKPMHNLRRTDTLLVFVYAFLFKRRLRVSLVMRSTSFFLVLRRRGTKLRTRAACAARDNSCAREVSLLSLFCCA